MSSTSTSANYTRKQEATGDESSEDGGNDGDEEQGKQEVSSFCPLTCIPAFRCIVSARDCNNNNNNNSQNKSNQTVDTTEEEVSTNQQGLGLDLRVQQVEEEDTEFWVIDRIRLNSPLVDSPLEHGDIVIKVNGNDNIEEALHQMKNHPENHPIVSIVAYNPNPKAKFDIVDTWIHSSVYHETGGDYSLMGLHFHPSAAEERYLEIGSLATDSVWQSTTLLDTNDVLFAVNHVSTQNSNQESIRTVFQNNHDKKLPITLRTRIKSANGVTMATAMREKSETYNATFPYRGWSKNQKMFGIVMGSIALVFMILFVFVALNTSRHKDDSFNDNGSSRGVFCDPDLEGSCTVDGRPFRDVREVDISATTQTCSWDEHKLKSLWSTVRDPAREYELENADSSALRQFPAAPSSSSFHDGGDANRKNDWLDRALGEHASIASFAAFTIALMTNQAPPDLIHDALQAAMDEWNHATISFAWANHHMLSSTSSSSKNDDDSNLSLLHEPSALPPTQHVFQQDLTALAKSTVLEGCIGETLSALDLANQVDNQKVNIVGRDEDSLSLPMIDSLRTIALEEAGHAALAWRTVRWVCTSDKEACHAVQKNVLNVASMESLSHQRFPQATEQHQQMWHKIYHQLIPYAMGEEVGADCTTPLSNKSDTTLIQTISDKIIRLCLCRDLKNIVAST